MFPSLALILNDSFVAIEKKVETTLGLGLPQSDGHLVLHMDACHKEVSFILMQ